MSRLNAMDESYLSVTLFNKPTLFTSMRIDRNTVPDSLFSYDIRHSDEDGGVAATIERFVVVNHMGTVITSEPLDFGKCGYIELDDEQCDLNFASDYDCRTITEYLKCLPGSSIR